MSVAFETRVGVAVFTETGAMGGEGFVPVGDFVVCLSAAFVGSHTKVLFAARTLVGEDEICAVAGDKACAHMLWVDEVIGGTVGRVISREIVFSRVDVVNKIMFVPGLDFLREVGGDKRMLRSSVGTCGRRLSGAVHFGVLVKLVGEKDEAWVDVLGSGRSTWCGSSGGPRGSMWKAWSLLFERLGVKDR